MADSLAALPEATQTVLVAWVRAGGGLLITGGPLSLDRDTYGPLAAVLPIELTPAQDLARATLAYRRALLLDATQERAQRNLSWIRSRAPNWLPQPASTGAFESLFFWHHTLSLAQRRLLAAAAFALAVLLFTPWFRAPSRNRLLRRLALLASLVWIAMEASAMLEQDAAKVEGLLKDLTATQAALSDHVKNNEEHIKKNLYGERNWTALRTLKELVKNSRELVTLGKKYVRQLRDAAGDPKKFEKFKKKAFHWAHGAGTKVRDKYNRGIAALRLSTPW